MTKRQAIWLTIRIAGLIIIAYTIVSLVSVLKVIGVGAGTVLKSQGDVSSALGLAIVFQVVELACYAVAGLYLINDGSALYSFLNKEDDGEDSRIKKIFEKEE